MEVLQPFQRKRALARLRDPRRIHATFRRFVVQLKYISFKLHLVHFNRKYGDDLGGAIEKGNGAQDTLAVLGIMFRMTEADNKKLQPLIEGTKLR